MKMSIVAKIGGALFGLAVLFAPAAYADDGRSIADQWRYYCSHEHDTRYDSYCERFRDDGDRDRDSWGHDRWREYCRHHRDERRRRSAAAAMGHRHV